jgi:hypothetical protein
MEKRWELTPVEDTSGIVDLIATPNRVMGIAGYRDGTVFSVDPEDGALEATAKFPHGQEHYRAQDGRYYGVARGPYGEGGIVKITPETRTISRLQGADVYAHVGESTLIDTALYFVDPESWRLHSVEGFVQG